MILTIKSKFLNMGRKYHIETMLTFNNYGLKSGYLFKLEFEKFYDMVDRDCLLEVLHRRGFEER